MGIFGPDPDEVAASLKEKMYEIEESLQEQIKELAHRVHKLELERAREATR